MFLSRVRLNWLTEGGTFNRCWRTRFWRWRRTYLGQRTNRVISRLGGKAWPTPNLRGVLWKRLVSGAFLATTFFFPPLRAAGCTSNNTCVSHWTLSKEVLSSRGTRIPSWIMKKKELGKPKILEVLFRSLIFIARKLSSKKSYEGYYDPWNRQ